MASLQGYSDSDHAGDTCDRKSSSRHVFFLGENAITWTSQNQKIVAIISAKYVAIAGATCQGVWLTRLLAKMLGQEPTKLYVDNKSAITLAKNPVHHDRNRHIDVKFHFVRDSMEAGQVEILHVRTHEQFVDALTKALGRVHFVEMR